MIGTSVLLAVVQFSVVDRPMLTPVFVRATSSAATPGEPPTLALALIGIGIIAAYAGIRRFARPKRGLHQRYQLTASADQTTAETPKRGAA